MSQSDTGKRIWWPGFDRLTSLRGWDTDAERARQLRISHATLTNLRAGRVLAGAKVVDRVLTVFGAVFYDVLFERSSETSPSEEAA